MTEKTKSRRLLLKTMALGGATLAVAPAHWSKPVIDKLITPAHAQACSAAAGTYRYNFTSEEGVPEFATWEWPGGQGPHSVGVEIGEVDGESFGVFPLRLLLAQSKAEAETRLGSSVDGEGLEGTSPTAPAGCTWYVSADDLEAAGLND